MNIRMCNCSKPKPKPGTTTPQPSSAVSQSFALETNGRTQVFGSMLEAQAANKRQGDQGRVRVVPRRGTL